MDEFVDRILERAATILYGIAVFSLGDFIARSLYGEMATTKDILNGMLISLLVITGILTIISPLIVKFISKIFDGEKYE